MATNQDPFIKLTEEWEPKIRAEFLASVQQIKDRVILKALIGALENGDVNMALEVLGITDLDFQNLRLALPEMFTQSGLTFSELVPAMRTAAGSVVKFVFDARNLQAEAWIASRSSELITGNLVSGQRDLVRQHLTEGLQTGTNPRQTALELVGRIDRKTSSRTGGILGIADNQKAWVDAYKAELEAGDSASLRNALARKLRDKRFDRSLKKALKSGEPIPADIRAKMLVSYENRQLKLRGDWIAREETAKALGEAHKQTWDQAIDRGQVNRQDVMKFPRAVGDDRTRPWHLEVEKLNKDGVQWDEPYKVPPSMSPQYHAPYEGEIMCRCNERVRLRYNR